MGTVDRMDEDKGGRKTCEIGEMRHSGPVSLAITSRAIPKEKGAGKVLLHRPPLFPFFMAGFEAHLARATRPTTA